MEIDASNTRPGNGRTRADYLQCMRGRCFGCGASGHSKAQCNQSQARCAYCARTGHVENVCQDKFMGYSRGRGLNAPRRQRVAATQEKPFSLFDEDAPAPPSSSISATSSPSSSNSFAVLQKLMEEQNRNLSALTNVQQSF